MKPIYTLSDEEHAELYRVLDGVGKNPYEEYEAFSQAVRDLVERGEVPQFFVDVAHRIRAEREAGTSDAHVIRNCPIDPELPDLGDEDPVAVKHAAKRTFIGEALLELFAQLAGNPLLAYARNWGDFFTDVVAIRKYSGMLTGYSDSELFFHNDRTAHDVRADYIALLGMRCPGNDLIYTGFIDGRAMLDELTENEQAILRRPYYITPFDVFSKEKNESLTFSEVHPILENHHSFRYLDTSTTTAPGSPVEAKDALLALKDALAKVEKQRHRILERDLFLLANQDGLHSREKIEINDPAEARKRWLLKTYAFRDDAAADRHADKWLDSVRGRVAD
ncbi:TauD/TfdA family dioxygenase [Streptomyces sp. NPDC002092]